MKVQSGDQLIGSRTFSRTDTPWFMQTRWIEERADFHFCFSLHLSIYFGTSEAEGALKKSRELTFPPQVHQQGHLRIRVSLNNLQQKVKRRHSWRFLLVLQLGGRAQRSTMNPPDWIQASYVTYLCCRYLWLTYKQSKQQQVTTVGQTEKYWHTQVGSELQHRGERLKKQLRDCFRRCAWLKNHQAKTCCWSTHFLLFLFKRNYRELSVVSFIFSYLLSVNEEDECVGTGLGAGPGAGAAAGLWIVGRHSAVRCCCGASSVRECESSAAHWPGAPRRGVSRNWNVSICVTIKTVVSAFAWNFPPKKQRNKMFFSV